MFKPGDRVRKVRGDINIGMTGTVVTCPRIVSEDMWFLFVLRFGLDPTTVMEVDADGLVTDGTRGHLVTGIGITAIDEWELIPPDVEEKVMETEEELCLVSE